MTKTVLITGSTDGLGKDVALRLARQGWKVLLHGRNPGKGMSVMSEIATASGNDMLQYFNADLSSLVDAADLASAVMHATDRLDLLINNAGIGPQKTDSPRRRSPDGVELFFAVNYLAGYLLARELLPLLRQSAPSRIINVASLAQAPVNFDDPMLENGYDDFLAYRQSKLAQILHANDLAAQLEGSGVTANSLHPASLMNTKMVTESSYLPDSRTSVEEGADALEYLATASELAQTSGSYFDGRNRAEADPQSTDPQARRQLRELSEKLVNEALACA